MFFKTRKIWETADGKKGDFFELLPDKLTVKDFNSWVDKSDQTGSLFEEVRMQPFSIPTDLIRTWRTINSVEKISGPYERNLFNAFVKILERNWSRGLNVVAHSAGYDSRVLGQVIKELGYDNVLFVECSGEGVEFKKIMKIQGFKRDQWMVYNDSVRPVDYNEYSFTFDINRFDGLVGYPMNIWYDPWKDMTERGIIPADCKIFIGPGAYIERMFKRYGFTGFCKREYKWQLSRFGFYGDKCIPWIEPEYIHELARHKTIRMEKHKRVTMGLFNKYCQHLKHIPNPRITVELKMRGYRTVSDMIMKRIIKEYENSWFGRHYPCKPSNYIEYSKWWGHWNASQICEYLINKGHEICKQH